MLDKNPRPPGPDVGSVLSQNSLNSILCDDPFPKASFLHRVIATAAVPALYLDFDLLYSGLVSSGILPAGRNLRLFRPTAAELQDTLVAVLERISAEESIVIVDSLNGFHSILDRADAGRLINSYVMLLDMAARGTGSRIVLASMARIRRESWVLSPTGRHVIAPGSTNIRLTQNGSAVTASILDAENAVVRSVAL